MKYHYLDRTHKKPFSTKDIYIIEYEWEPIWFCSVNHFPHPHIKNMKKVHRLVIRPDYQWLWIWIRFLEFVAKIYVERWYVFTITTSSNSLLQWLKKRSNRKCFRYWIINWTNKWKWFEHLNKTCSIDRITWSFRYIPQK
jgi:hypothetical protein